jgi:aminocarboxymuconate-semialdehyde decarboxylase
VVTVIDMHTHVFPRGLPHPDSFRGSTAWPWLEVAEDEQTGQIIRGDKPFRVVTNQCFDLNARLGAMNAAGVDVQVLSPVPVMLPAVTASPTSGDWCRAVNRRIAAEIESCSAPNRFRWLATVPPPDLPGSGAVLTEAIGLGAAGFEIGTTIAGYELDHRGLDPFWRAASEADAAVFVHPTDPTTIRRGSQPYEFAIGMHTDTAIAATAVVLGGVLDRFPSLRVGFSHGCGTFAWSLPRIVRGSTLRAQPSGSFHDALARVQQNVRRLWADTLVFDPELLPLLIDRFGADHLMLGSDHPFYPQDWGSPLDMLEEATSLGHCTHQQRSDITGANPQRFLNLENLEDLRNPDQPAEQDVESTHG